MAKFNYDLSFSAGSQQEADKKVNALCILGTKVSAEALETLSAKLTGPQLERLAYVLKNEPGMAALAINYLGV